MSNLNLSNKFNYLFRFSIQYFPSFLFYRLKTFFNLLFLNLIGNNIYLVFNKKIKKILYKVFSLSENLDNQLSDCITCL